MKKMFAILMALCLLCGCAMAESTDLTWAEVEAAAAEAGIEGNFASIADLGIKMLIPTGFQEIELTEDDVNNGYISYLTNADQTNNVAIMYANVEGMSLEDYAAALPGVGATEIEPGTLNGIPVVTYEMPENDSANVAMTTSTGYVIEFVFAPVSDESFKTIAMFMTASIQPE